MLTKQYTEGFMMKVVVFIEGGLVREVVAKKDLEIKIIDSDLEGLDQEDIITVEGQQQYVHNGVEIKTDCNRVASIVNKVEEQEKSNE